MKSMYVLALSLSMWLTGISSGAEPEPAAAGTNMETVPITRLVDRVARKTGRQFIVDPRVRVDVPLAGLDVESVDYDRLLAILRVNMLVAVQEKGFVTIVPDANARQLAGRTFFDLGFKAGDDELVTVMLTAKNVCTAQVVPVLRPLMPQAAHLAAFPDANVIIINDRAANVRRIGEMFEKLDRLAPAGERCGTDRGSSNQVSGSARFGDRVGVRGLRDEPGERGSGLLLAREQ
jgi:type II secretory pathway component GspD/PulD (secretin)